MIASSRDIVLGRIRAALDRDTQPVDSAALDRRVTSAPRWTRPAQKETAAALFVAKAQASLTLFHPVALLHDVPAAVRVIAAERGLADGVMGISVAPSLRALDWANGPSVHFGSGRMQESIAVSDALAGVAETGSLVLHSASDRPTSLNFLPDLHIAVLHKSAIVPHFEDVWPLLRRVQPWPRTVNIISAASRTADVAQVVVRPAHGPKLLLILLVEAP